MRRFITVGVIAAISLLSLTGKAKEKFAPAPSSPLYVDGSLCTKPDQIVFSCPLAKNRKIVSVCAAGAAAPHRFYYAFGKQHAVEMTYPSGPAVSNAGFSHSFLFYSGGTGGYAYSLITDGFKYIVYSISGKFNYSDGGVIVKKAADIYAVVDMKCTKGLINESLDSPVLDETLKWEKDSDITGHGIPSVK